MGKLTFENTSPPFFVDIPGPSSGLIIGTTEYQDVATKFFGVEGVSIMRGGQSQRPLSSVVWFADSSFTTSSELFSALTQITSKSGFTGTVKEVGTDTFQREFQGCQLVVAEMIAGEGQPFPTPIYDFSGSLIGVPCWTAYVRLQWRQIQ